MMTLNRTNIMKNCPHFQAFQQKRTEAAKREEENAILEAGRILQKIDREEAENKAAETLATTHLPRHEQDLPLGHWRFTDAELLGLQLEGNDKILELIESKCGGREK
jgi:hypothetical protein